MLNLTAFVLEKDVTKLKKGNKKLEARGRIQDVYHPVAKKLLVNNLCC